MERRAGLDREVCKAETCTVTGSIPGQKNSLESKGITQSSSNINPNPGTGQIPENLMTTRWGLHPGPERMLLFWIDNHGKVVHVCPHIHTK